MSKISSFFGRNTRCAWFCTAASLLTLASAGAEDRLRVNEPDARHAIVSRVEPAYPPIAKQMRIGGQAIVDAYVDEAGKVEKVEPVTGNPLLTNAARSAVERWKFSPFSAAGKASSAVVRLTFHFNL